MEFGEVKQLEALLEKLKDHIGETICVIPAHWHEGYTIATYDKNGDLQKSALAVDIIGCLEKLDRPII